jgi:hypothetical protein
MCKLCPIFSPPCRNWSPNYSVLVLKKSIKIVLWHIMCLNGSKWMVWVIFMRFQAFGALYVVQIYLLTLLSLLLVWKEDPPPFDTWGQRLTGQSRLVPPVSTYDSKHAETDNNDIDTFHSKHAEVTIFIPTMLKQPVLDIIKSRHAETVHFDQESIHSWDAETEIFLTKHIPYILELTILPTAFPFHAETDFFRHDTFQTCCNYPFWEDSTFNPCWN